MEPTEKPQRIYALREGVRVFRSGEEIRFRKGVWSYTEAVVRLAGQEERVVRFFTAVYDALVRVHEADLEVIGSELGASAEEINSYCELLENLKRQQFLHSNDQRDVARAVGALLGGSLSGFAEGVGVPRPVLFFTDSDYIREAAKTLSKEIGLALDLLDDETIQTLATADLTTRIDAVQHKETEVSLEKVFRPYACVLGCVAAPNMSVLRNLNRLLIAAEKPLILGLIDGPFISVLGTLATETGCFECYEQRMLARLEDTVVYHRFVESTVKGADAVGPWFSAQMHMLMAAVVSEGLIYSSLGLMRFAGRVVNIYVPLLEIQAQDLLRVPYCPACGFISKARMNEAYTSTNRLVTEMLANIELEG